MSLPLVVRPLISFQYTHGAVNHTFNLMAFMLVDFFTVVFSFLQAGRVHKVLLFMKAVIDHGFVTQVVAPHPACYTWWRWRTDAPKVMITHMSQLYCYLLQIVMRDFSLESHRYMYVIAKFMVHSDMLISIVSWLLPKIMSWFMKQLLPEMQYKLRMWIFV